MITMREDPVVSEVTATLREWHKIWLSLYLDNQIELFERISSLLNELIDTRAELIAVIKQSQTQDAISREQQIVELKREIVTQLDLGNRLLNLDLVPRDPNFKPVDPVELSPLKLYQLHSEAAITAVPIGLANSHGCQESIISATGSTLSSSSQTSSDSVANNPYQSSYHLQLATKSQYLTSLPPDELVEVYFSIIDATNNNATPPFKPVTEKFLIQIQNDEVVYGSPNTFFTNVGPPQNRDMSLQVQVYRVGKMTLADGQRSAFGKQQSSHQLMNDGSTNSLSTNNKYTSNALSRVRHSTIGFFDNAPKYRRPFGTTMVTLKDYLKGSKEHPVSVRVVATNESDFTQVQDQLVKRSHTLKMNQSLPSVHLDLSVKFISCPQESLFKVAAIGPYCLTEKRGFPDVVMPGDFKNDLHFTLESAEFEKGGKSISKNIEASISLIDKSGIVIDNCISPASNCDNVSTHKSCIFYHSNSPKWNESIKITVPLSEFDSAHIRIEFRHCSTKEKDKKFLGFSFLPLSDDDGTVIPDKSHELYLYKCDSHLWEDESLNLCKYTSLPYGPASKMQSNIKPNSQSGFSHSNREVVTVSTFLLSTKLTQNKDLLNLLKWRELIKRNPKDFEVALKNVLTLKGEEIVKFLQDILDTLFDTFSLFSTSEDDYSALIFKVLVHIFLLLDDPKYQHFKPVLDTYASAHFSATLVYKGLLACVKKCLEYSTVVERHVPIQKCFKSIRYVFQFIVQSKILYSKATGEQNDESFLADLNRLFGLFERMLANNNPKLIPIQVAFLESFPGALSHLVRVISPTELAHTVTLLVGSVGFQLPPALSRAKLHFMKETVLSGLIKNQDVRIMIADNFCKHLNCYIKLSEELELCYEVLEILIMKIHDCHWPVIYRLYQLAAKSRTHDEALEVIPVMTVGEINQLTKVGHIQANQLDMAIISLSGELEPFINLMDPLLQLLDMLVRDFNIDRLLVQKYCTCLLTILKLMGKSSFDSFMKKRILDYLKLCNLFFSFRAVYNRDWSIMQLTSHAILEHPIDEISKDIKAKNEVQPNVRQLSPYIKLIVDFITHPTLQLEVFSESKRRYVLAVFGDLRLKFASQLMRFWSNLSKPTICDLIPTSIQSFLDASLLPNDELQHKLMPVFYDMIDAEDHSKSKSKQIERCLIDNLDLYMNLDRGDAKFVENFGSILRSMIIDGSPAWEQRGYRLIGTFTRLMNLLISYRQSLDGSDSRGKQMSCLVDLLNFYKSQERLDLHLRYLFKLCDMHLEAGNHTEAAFTLKLYTDEIRWCNRSLSPLDGYRPEEPEWRRKENLYQRIIHYFDTGKCWEEAIPLCKELAGFYENFLVDYEKVSSTLKKLAQFLDNILTEHRPEREYFRVEFLGSDLPNHVRGKEFIYRGGEYERLAAFIQRTTSEFPEAKVLNPKSRQSVVADSPGQYMIISNVKPVPSLQEHLTSGQRKISDKIVQYYLNNRVDVFSYDVPIIKDDPSGSKDKASGAEANVRNLWVGRHILKLKKHLPNILLWSEVVSRDQIEISPINHAIETISNMNVELSKLILSFTNDTSKQVSPLTMRLQGVIEAAVNGGPAVFVNAFLRRQPGDSDHDPDPESLTRLRDLIKKQFSILDTGLALHAKLVSQDVLPLHNRLVERLQNAKKSMLDETNQLPENNYEQLVPIDGASARDSLVAGKLTTQEDANDAKDEADGCHDVNGNVFGDIDDQIYSQPCEPSLERIMRSSGSKSELSSPSRGQHYNGTSSSLSTLTLLSNLNVNRSRLSATPSKDPVSQTSQLSNNELCVRAARKLTYDSGLSTDGSRNSYNRSRASLSSVSSQDTAPPLPPRSFIADRQQMARTLNRPRATTVVAHRTSSPPEATTMRRIPREPPEIISLPPKHSMGPQLGMDVVNPASAIRAGLPSSLPRLMQPALGVSQIQPHIHPMGNSDQVDSK